MPEIVHDYTSTGCIPLPRVQTSTTQTVVCHHGVARKAGWASPSLTLFHSSPSPPLRSRSRIATRVSGGALKPNSFCCQDYRHQSVTVSENRCSDVSVILAPFVSNFRLISQLCTKTASMPLVFRLFRTVTDSRVCLCNVYTRMDTDDVTRARVPCDRRASNDCNERQRVTEIRHSTR